MIALTTPIAWDGSTPCRKYKIAARAPTKTVTIASEATPRSEDALSVPISHVTPARMPRNIPRTITVFIACPTSRPLSRYKTPPSNVTTTAITPIAIRALVDGAAIPEMIRMAAANASIAIDREIAAALLFSTGRVPSKYKTPPSTAIAAAMANSVLVTVDIL